MRRASGWLAAVLPLACTGEPGPVRADAGMPAVKALPDMPRPVAEAPVGPPSVVEAPVPVAQPPLALHLVAQRDGPLQLHVPGADAVVVAAAPAFALLGPDDQLRRDPSWIRGLAESKIDDTEVVALAFAGEQPTWLVTWSHNTRMLDESLVFRWLGDRWQRVRSESGGVSWYYDGIAPWHGGQLGLRRLAVNPDGWVLQYEGEEPYRVRQQEALLARLEAPPRFEVTFGAVKQPLPQVPRDLRVASFITLPAGDVLAIVEVPRYPGKVEHADLREMTAAVARWTVGEVQHRLEALPGVRVSPTLHLSSGTGPGTAFVYGDAGRDHQFGDASDEPYIATEGDGVWTEFEAPEDAPIASMAVGSDRVLWAVSGREFMGRTQLWRNGEDDRWRRVELAPVRFTGDESEWPVKPLQVHVRGVDDLWVVGTTETLGSEPDYYGPARHVVLRKRAAAAVLELPDAGELHTELSEWMDLKPWRPGMPAPQRLRYPPELRGLTKLEQAEEHRCRVVFVTLGEGSPAVEASLVAVAPGLAAKHALQVDLAEARVQERVIVGMRVVVPRQHQDAVPAFVAAVTRASPGLRPLTRCHDPKVTRSFGPPGVPQPESVVADDEDIESDENDE